MFLESRVDLGTSLETAEDLLMELAEFQTRAKVHDCHMTRSQRSHVKTSINPLYPDDDYRRHEANSLKKQNIMYKVLTPSIKPPI